MNPTEVLSQIGENILSEFVSKKRVLSFGEYFALAAQEPHVHARNTAQYIVDCFEHFGREEIERPGETVTRFKLFDAPFDNGREPLIGQEQCQLAIYRVLRNFCNEGRINKLIMLHGPNGSAKSSLVRLIARALVNYSHSDEGALYRFNWIFPTKVVSKKRLGFSEQYQNRAISPLESFAHLEEDEIDAKLSSSFRDHPLFLIPKSRRREYLQQFIENTADAKEFRLSDYILHGDLSPRERQIYEALITAYQGDYRRVLEHVQVERFFISRRYRVGIATVEPQIHVDASLRQLTADQQLGALPRMLQNLSLFEPFGDLVDANRGLIEYSDMLKRQLESFKYLLSTVENGTVPVMTNTLYLDCAFFGSSNESHLNAFKEYPDFTSFKARMELVKVHYILNYQVEQQIYDNQIDRHVVAKPIAPHASYVAALWAVLTRLEKPVPERYPPSIRDAVAKLTPLEKADLYALGRPPSHLPQDKANELLKYLPDVLSETQNAANYEGRTGASPREIKTILLNAAQSPHYVYLSPLAVFDELEELVKNRSVYEFLKQDPVGEYHNNGKFISVVRDRYVEIVDREVRTSMGLISEAQYQDVFERYVNHVSYSLKKEKLYDKVTGEYIEPDKDMLRELESVFAISKNPETFRHEIISRIGAWSLDHPNQKVDYRRLFPKLFESLERNYFERQRKGILHITNQMLRYFNEGSAGMNPKDMEHVESTLQRLEQEFGYTAESARDTVTFLYRHRYKET